MTSFTIVTSGPVIVTEQRSLQGAIAYAQKYMPCGLRSHFEVERRSGRALVKVVGPSGRVQNTVRISPSSAFRRVAH